MGNSSKKPENSFVVNDDGIFIKNGENEINLTKNGIHAKGNDNVTNINKDGIFVNGQLKNKNTLKDLINQQINGNDFNGFSTIQNINGQVKVCSQNECVQFACWNTKTTGNKVYCDNKLYFEFVDGHFKDMKS